MSKAYDSVYISLLKEALRRIKVPESIIKLIREIFSKRQNYIITSQGNTD